MAHLLYKGAPYTQVEGLDSEGPLYNTQSMKAALAYSVSGVAGRSALHRRLATLAFCVMFICTLTLCSLQVYFFNKDHEAVSIYGLHEKPIVSCYYNLPDESQSNSLMPADINPYLCTHVNIAFARVVNKEIKLDDNQYKYLHDVVKLKQVNSDLKILLSVGGGGSDNGFPEMVVNHASRKIFIRSIKYMLSNYKLDGIDLDWEFPALPSEVHQQSKSFLARQRQHFTQLLQEIKAEYVREKKNYILSIAAGAPKTIVDVSYDISYIDMLVDYVNVMTYDYHFYSKFTPFTGLNSPLYPRTEESMFLATLNINYTVHLYIDKGLSPNKLVVGIPTYGHTFKLVNANNHKVGSPASGFGSIGNFINYPDVCELLNNTTDINMIVDPQARVPYMYWKKEWISFESAESVAEKARFIRDNHLGGAMIYSLNADDYAGTCKGPALKFPLSAIVRNTLTG